MWHARAQVCCSSAHGAHRRCWSARTSSPTTRAAAARRRSSSMLRVNMRKTIPKRRQTPLQGPLRSSAGGAAAAPSNGDAAAHVLSGCAPSQGPAQVLVMDTTLRGDLSELLLGGDKSAAGKTAVRAVAPLRSTTKLLMQAAAVHAAEGAGSESGLQSLVGKLFSRDADAGGATLALDNHVPRPARPPARPRSHARGQQTPGTPHRAPLRAAARRGRHAAPRGVGSCRWCKCTRSTPRCPPSPPPVPVLTGHASSLPRY